MCWYVDNQTDICTCSWKRTSTNVMKKLWILRQTPHRGNTAVCIVFQPPMNAKTMNSVWMHKHLGIALPMGRKPHPLGNTSVLKTIIMALEDKGRSGYDVRAEYINRSFLLAPDCRWSTLALQFIFIHTKQQTFLMGMTRMFFLDHSTYFWN